ncbi:MAG: GlxA family transcriptional regulator [Alphaproteobacteria bacterium]|nr:GlxA family transcriptional regulator [Alphaproteobacteria bacterium]
MKIARKPAPGQAPQKRLRVGFLLARNFTLSAFSLFVDTLRLASDELDRSGRKYLDWEVLSDSTQLVKSSCGVFVAPTARLSARDAFDYLVVVGGRLNVEEPLSHAEVQYIRQTSAAGKPVIGLCTASFILADAGLMAGKPACVSWLHRAEFEERHPGISVVSDKLFVEEGLITTCAGGTAAADLAGHIVKKHLGTGSAAKAMQILQIERQRSGADFQARVPLGKAPPKDQRVREALAVMEQLLDQKWDVEWLALRLGITRRHLERLFKQEFGTGPRGVFTRVRMERGRVMLVNTEEALARIAFELGYDSTAQFSRQFRAHFGASPLDVRAEARGRVQ